MAEHAGGLWGHRLTFLGLAALIAFVQLLPLDLGPGGFPGPDVLLLLALSWVVMRPDYVPVTLLAVVFFLADLLFMRPLGLWTALVILASEFLRVRSFTLRDTPFLLEWLQVAAAITVIIASWLGLPVSSTHIAVGGVFGVGFLREWLDQSIGRVAEGVLARHVGEPAGGDAVEIDPHPVGPALGPPGGQHGGALVAEHVKDGEAAVPEGVDRLPQADQARDGASPARGDDHRRQVRQQPGLCEVALNAWGRVDEQAPGRASDPQGPSEPAAVEGHGAPWAAVRKASSWAVGA